MDAAPSVPVLVLRKLVESVHNQPKSLHVFIFPKLMMPVWGGAAVQDG